MLTKHTAEFVAKCDVCGTTETFDAYSHAEAWEKLKKAAWCVRMRAFPIIHICPECPVEVKKMAPNS